MKKQHTFSLILLASSALLASNAFAQTSPTSGAAQTPAAKPQSSTAATAAAPRFYVIMARRWLPEPFPSCTRLRR